MDYTVRLDRFEGPYTKLLSLIEERKLSITELGLASLADDYISYTQTLSEKDHLDISQFIVVASTLMLMKVRSLLPKLDYTTTEEKQIQDLTHKLHLLAYLDTISKKINATFVQKQFFGYNKARIKKEGAKIPESLTPKLLQKLAEDLLGTISKKEFIREVSMTRKTSLEETTAIIRSVGEGAQSLRLISTQIQDENRLILSFISLLELVRQGEIHAYQENTSDVIFERIVVLQ